jgi:hypothetical protein
MPLYKSCVWESGKLSKVQASTCHHGIEVLVAFE